MKTFQSIVICMIISYSAFGQKQIQHSAFKQAEEMIAFYNQRNISKFVDYLLPVYYANDTASKTDLCKIFEKVLKNDTDSIFLREMLKISKSKNQYQALFVVNFRSKKFYIIGVSDNNGSVWKFTQPCNEKMKFTQLLNLIPSLEGSFAEILDPKFGKRVKYVKGDAIVPFTFADIDGNEISSSSMKGQAIVLNFWSISCAPCVMEMPELNKLVEKYENVNFIAPAVYSSKESIKNDFLPKQPFLYDIVTIDGNDYEISSYPTHVILNKKHEVVEIITGYSEKNIQRLEMLIIGL